MLFNTFESFENFHAHFVAKVGRFQYRLSTLRLQDRIQAILEFVLKILKGILWVWVTTQALTEMYLDEAWLFHKKVLQTGLSLLVGNPHIMTIIYTYIHTGLFEFPFWGGRHHLLSTFTPDAKFKRFQKSF